MKSLDAHGITAKFDPWGVLVRQWRLHDVHVQSGDVEIQIYEANPEPVKAKPWFAIFLPNRVYLKRIQSDQANITWRFRGERAGFFGTQLLITPNGRDFDYVATGGRLKMAVVPDLDLRRTHVLITKTLLTLYDLDLASDSQSGESIRAQGHAGLGQDKSIDVKVNFNSVPISQWLPAEWKGHLKGSAFGDIHWTGKDPKLESSSGEGSLRIDNGRVDDVPLLKKLAELAQKKSFERLDLNECCLVLRGAIRRSTSRTSLSRRRANSGLREKFPSSVGCCGARSDLGLPVNIWIGYRTPKKYLADAQEAIYGPTYIYPARLMNPGKTSASASSNFSKNRPALISASCFVSSAIG